MSKTTDSRNFNGSFNERIGGYDLDSRQSLSELLDVGWFTVYDVADNYKKYL